VTQSAKTTGISSLSQLLFFLTPQGTLASFLRRYEGTLDHKIAMAPHKTSASVGSVSSGTFDASKYGAAGASSSGSDQGSLVYSGKGRQWIMGTKAFEARMPHHDGIKALWETKWKFPVSPLTFFAACVFLRMGVLVLLEFQYHHDSGFHISFCIRGSRGGGFPVAPPSINHE